MAAKVNPAEAIGFGFYHFHPRWTVHYGEEIEKRYEEFEDVVKAIDVMLPLVNKTRK